MLCYYIATQQRVQAIINKIAYWSTIYLLQKAVSFYLPIISSIRHCTDDVCKLG